MKLNEIARLDKKMKGLDLGLFEKSGALFVLLLYAYKHNIAYTESQRLHLLNCYHNQQEVTFT